jgi:RimJ/RimL family protein N-acetyltransferase
MEDVPLVHALWTDEHVRYFLFDDRIISPDEARLFVEGSLANFEQYGYGLWLVFPARESYRLVGFAGFLCLEEETPGLIYGVQPDFCGRGYATEAAGAVLRYAFEELDLTKVKADVDEPNAASVRVLEKLGMRRTGRAVVKGRPLLYFERSRVEGEVTQNDAAGRE